MAKSMALGVVAQAVAAKTPKAKGESQLMWRKAHMTWAYQYLGMSKADGQ